MRDARGAMGGGGGATRPTTQEARTRGAESGASVWGGSRGRGEGGEGMGSVARPATTRRGRSHASSPAPQRRAARLPRAIAAAAACLRVLTPRRHLRTRPPGRRCVRRTGWRACHRSRSAAACCLRAAADGARACACMLGDGSRGRRDASSTTLHPLSRTVQRWQQRAPASMPATAPRAAPCSCGAHPACR